MWYYWIQKDKNALESSDVTEVEIKEIRDDLFKLSGAMHDNRPRKSKNQAFKLFIYIHLMNELRSVWHKLPHHIKGANFFL